VVEVPLFSSPFDRFSFAPAPSSFSQLKTIVRLRRVIVCKLFSVGDKELARLGVRGFPCPQRARERGHLRRGLTSSSGPGPPAA
jgi:hypothetical protein